ncbi:MAG TPA: ABC transporter ATP-binding protein [Catalimonadaceae bacterium]|nr:ABC transporter ATP-binding protein [Catalimonadaceae bacterium]
MKLSCESKGLGHRFQNIFLFRHLNFILKEGAVTFVTGHNGSGKSTLLKIVTGAMQPIEGSVQFYDSTSLLENDVVWKYIGFVSPYQELPEDLTLNELIEFQKQMDQQPTAAEFYEDLIQLFRMEKERDKQVRFFSTGMKQKAKFILNLSQSRPIWILDEPTSNLDPASVDHFWNFIQSNKSGRLILVASNDPAEFNFADETIVLST